MKRSRKNLNNSFRFFLCVIDTVNDIYLYSYIQKFFEMSLQDNIMTAMKAGDEIKRYLWHLQH